MLGGWLVKVDHDVAVGLVPSHGYVRLGQEAPSPWKDLFIEVSHLGSVPRIFEQHNVSCIQTDGAMWGRAVEYVLYQVYNGSVHVIGFLGEPGQHFFGVRRLEVVDDQQSAWFRFEVAGRAALNELVEQGA